MEILVCSKHSAWSCPPCWSYVQGLQEEIDMIYNTRIDNVVMAMSTLTKPLGGITE